MGIAAVFTDPQFQLLMRALNQSEGVEILDAPSVATRSGNPVISQSGERRYGVIPVTGADGFTIDLQIFLPEHGEALLERGEALDNQIPLTIWDGQTVAIARKDAEGRDRTVFVKAQLMDPPGTPINPAGIPIPSGGEKESPTPDHSPELSEKIVGLLQRTNLSKIYSQSTHVVREGESLYGIATDAKTTIAAIKRINGLEKDDLEIGQLLFLPGNLKETKQESPFLNEVIISGIKFTDVPFVNALGHIQEVLLSHDKVKTLFPNEAPRIVLKEAERFDDTKITLELRNVPVREALRYITSLAECEYEIEGSRIIVFPKQAELE